MKVEQMKCRARLEFQVLRLFDVALLYQRVALEYHLLSLIYALEAPLFLILKHSVRCSLKDGDCYFRCQNPLFGCTLDCIAERYGRLKIYLFCPKNVFLKYSRCSIAIFIRVRDICARCGERAVVVPVLFCTFSGRTRC